MSDRPVCLTLIVPRQLREEVFDYLIEQTDLVSGFTASHAAGHGAEVRLQTAAVQMILAERNAAGLLDRLRASFAGTKLVYWTMPVTEFGTID
jgi:hypothetical protein